MPGNPHQCVQVVCVANIHQAEVDAELLANFHGHGAHQSPQGLTARIVNVENRPPGHDGDLAGRVAAFPLQ